MRKYLVACIIVLAGCSSQTGDHGGGATSGGTDSAGKSAESNGSGIRLTLHKVMDTNGTGKLAGTYLVPDGYTASDEVKWIPNDYLTPVVVLSTIKSNDGEVVMESMGGLQFNFGHSPGGNFGIDPPKSVCAYLLNRWRKAHPDLKVSVDTKEDTEIPEASQNNGAMRMYAKRGVFKLRYAKNGANYLVKSSARVDVMMTNPTTTAIGGTLYEGAWVISNSYTVTAPESGHADAMKIYGIVLASQHTDPHFYNTVAQAREIIQRNFYQQLHQVMETSRIISQTNDEMSAAIDQQYQTSQAAGDREARNFDDYIRGVDRYQEGDGNVSLPSGYEHAWSDGNGKYIITDQHGYDPNVGGPNGTWHEMEKTR